MHRSRSVALVLALLLIAGAATPIGARHRERIASGPQCISLHAIRDETAEDEQGLLFHTGGSKLYRNHLPKPCDGLRRINTLSTLRLHPSGDGQLCRGDMIEVIEPDNLVGALAGADDGSTRSRCALGAFEPLTEMSLPEALRR